MKFQLAPAEKMLALSIGFTVALLTARVAYTSSVAYAFYIWNLFLGVIPIYFSRQLLHCNKINIKSITLFSCWLLFFPNAPYVITDIFHFGYQRGAPLWYDLLLVLSAAWCGLMAGFISLGYVDKFMHRYAAKKWRPIITGSFLFAASIGIYLGRFLRFNSWNVVNHPFTLARIGFAYTFKPYDHLNAWLFCVACTALLLLIYYGIKTLAVAGWQLRNAG